MLSDTVINATKIYSSSTHGLARLCIRNSGIKGGIEIRIPIIIHI